MSASSIYEAWSNVMAEVQAIGKHEHNSTQNFNFRGIDAVMNAVGPALRAEKVLVVPIASGVVADERYTTRNNAQMRGVTVNVTFRVYGPDGSCFDGQALGEAADSGDKAISKAHSVAYRTFLLQSLCIPTDEPDPDLESHERDDPEEQPEKTVRQTAEEFAANAGMDFWSVAADLIPALENRDDLTREQARAVCLEISNRKKAT